MERADPTRGCYAISQRHAARERLHWQNPIATTRGYVMWTLLRSGLVLVVTFAATTEAAAAPVRQSSPARPPAEIVFAWEQAGAEFGWMTLDETGSSHFRQGEAGLPGEIPAFRFPGWRWHLRGGFSDGGFRGGGLGGDFEAINPPLELPANLPDPGVWFGLDHTNCRFPDQWLKELARFKSLHTLDLRAQWGLG